MASLALSEITSEQNFRKIGSYLGQKGSRLPETPQKRLHFLELHQTRKYLKIYNLTTANATQMIHQNYVPHTPQDKMFNLAENWGVTYQGVRGCNLKTSQKEPEKQFFSLISTIS